MRKFFLVVIILGILIPLLIGSLRRPAIEPRPVQDLKTEFAAKHIPSVDHMKLAALQRKFSTPQEVTQACIACHTERAGEVMASTHWNWAREEYIEGHGIRYVGKRDILNNFCIGVSGNLESCDACHAGYGYVDSSFDFSDPKNIDCLICHDNSSTYTKTKMGMPAPSVDLTFVAQHVGPPQRTNCGTCHFFGGGGNNVKHGDLEKALFDPSRDVDVHMATAGSNLQCVACHTARNHRLLGKLYSISSMNRNRSTCEQCHSAVPHDNDVLNEHTVKVACQTCHIPRYARVNATKMTWDWSTAGQLRNGEPFETEDSSGNLAYASIKGTFGWERNAVPEYIWFNGTAGHYLLGDTVSPDRPIEINTLHGSYDDPDAKIVPVKIHRARQIYDPVTRMLIQPKLYAPVRGAGAFWKDFDWQQAATQGMKSVGLPYSGQYTFVATEMTWPINHMVAPKEQALQCVECHTRSNSRLAHLTGFYMPGRDTNRIVEAGGTGLLLLVILAVAVHGTVRIFLHLRARKGPLT